MSSGYLAALDVGERRIGVAIASAVAKLPAPYTTIDRNKITDATAWIEDMITKEDIRTLVVGLPRDMKGSETAQTAKVRSFASELTSRLSIPVVLQDEAVTSVDAEARLKARGKPYDKADIDAEAAAIILQDFLALSKGATA